MDTTRSVQDSAIDALTSLFTNILASKNNTNFEDLEREVIEVGHAAIAKALGKTLENLDVALCSNLPQGTHIHDLRRRTLVTEVGDVSFTYHRARNEEGFTYAPLATSLDLPTSRQLSPGALSFLVALGSNVSYQKAAELLARKGGSQVSAMTVMRSLKDEARNKAVQNPPASKAKLPQKKRAESSLGNMVEIDCKTPKLSRDESYLAKEFQVNPEKRPWASMRSFFSSLNLVKPSSRQRRGTSGRYLRIPLAQKGKTMGSYEREQQLIAAGSAQRGYTAQQYFAELDAHYDEELSSLTHRPDYSKTLFAPEHDDIYREFCAYVDLPKPRYFDLIENPLRVEGFSAADVYFAMKSKNPRIVEIDGAAVYNMLVKLRTQPEIAKRVLDFRPTCYQNGCGKGDAAFDRGLYASSTGK